MATTTLQCWVYRDDVKSIFPVKISRMETIGALKEIIKEKTHEFRNVTAKDLRLYSILIPEDDDESFEVKLKQLSLEGKSRLNSRTKVSKLPQSDKGEEVWLIVVDGPNSGSSAIEHPVAVVPDMTLICWLQGDKIDCVFPVEISSTETVGTLKAAIKNKNQVDFREIDARHIFLYKASIPCGERLHEILGGWKPVPEDRLPSIAFLSDIFPDHPLQRHIHIIVESPLFNHHTTQLQVGEQDDILTALIKSLKRNTTLSQSLVPSKAAKSSEYVKIQYGDRRILDCRCAAAEPANTVAPAIQLFNPAFAYFSSRAFDPEYDVPDDFVRNIRVLMTRFALIYTSKQDRRNHILPFLETAIGRPLEAIVSSDKNAPDFVALSSCEELSVYLIVGEDKNEFGDGGCDPSVHAAFSFLHIFRQEKNAGLLMRCCCPTFIVAHAGPWFTIMGGIITDNCIVQRLTDILWVPVHSVHDDDQYRQIARILYALRESIQRLDSWYKTIKAVIPLDLSAHHMRLHPRFCPSPNTYRYKNTLVKFAYQAPLEQSGSCITYLARTIEDKPKNIVVKFVTSYGEDVHEKMATLGFAPELFYCGPIKVTDDMPSYGKLRMVVMGYMEGLTLEVALQQRKVPQRFTDDLTRAFEELHGADYVYGDLREPNVIVTSGLEGTSTAQLIDFDWAGKDGEVKYPLSMSSSINWPPEVQGLVPIRKEHDIFMLESLKFHCSQSQPADPKGKRRATDTPSGQSPFKKTALGGEDMEVDNMNM